MMLQLTPQSRIFLATEPVDFRKGIDGLAAVCRQRTGRQPPGGRRLRLSQPLGHRPQTLALRRPGLLAMMKRLSQGRFPLVAHDSADARVPLSARELIIVLWNGDPERAQMAQDWRRVA